MCRNNHLGHHVPNFLVEPLLLFLVPHVPVPPESPRRRLAVHQVLAPDAGVATGQNAVDRGLIYYYFYYFREVKVRQIFDFTCAPCQAFFPMSQKSALMKESTQPSASRKMSVRTMPFLIKKSFFFFMFGKVFCQVTLV